LTARRAARAKTHVPGLLLASVAEADLQGA